MNISYVGYRIEYTHMVGFQVLLLSFNDNKRLTYAGYLRAGRVFSSGICAERYAEKYFCHRRTYPTVYEFYVGKLKDRDLPVSVVPTRRIPVVRPARSM